MVQTSLKSKRSANAPQSHEPNQHSRGSNADVEGTMLIEEQEHVQAAYDDNMDAAAEFNKDENDVADIVMNNNDDAAEEAMVESLRVAGMSQVDAKTISGKMFAFESQEPATFMEVYGRSIFDQAHIQRRNLNIKGLGALDFRTLKPDGQPWNFCVRADRKLARDMMNRLEPDWIVGAPPCTPFSIWNHGINFKKMDPTKVEGMIREGVQHLKFVCSLYRKQIRRGKYFLHEHPATAVSWREEHPSDCQAPECHDGSGRPVHVWPGDAVRN